MKDYIDCVADTVEYCSGTRPLPLSPNAVGTTVAPAKQTGVATLAAVNYPYNSKAGYDTSKRAGMVLATNGPGETRLLVSATGACGPYVGFTFDGVIEILTPSSLDGGGTPIDPNYYEARGIVQGSAFAGTIPNCYCVMQPDTSGSYALVATISNAQAGAFAVYASCADAVGLVTLYVDRFDGRNWTELTAFSLVGGSGEGGVLTAVGDVHTAYRFRAASDSAQILKVEINVVSTDADTSWICPASPNNLLPTKSLFADSISAGQIKEYFPVSAAEIITNTSKVIDQNGVGYAVSTQRYGSLFNSPGDTIPEIITNSQINYITMPAAEGLSGHSVPAMFQPFPLPFHNRGFGSDCRLYYFESAADAPQNYRISYATVISAIGVRTPMTPYTLSNYPAYWPLICNALALVNPMDCNPGHMAAASKVLKQFGNWIMKPENRKSLVEGAITAADVISMISASVAPRVSGAAKQASGALSYLR
jgi:hypothetical protein